MRLLKTFCLVFALTLILGHQLVPHVHGHATLHGDGFFAAQHQAELPWWMQLFSLDQGAEHLEHFRQNRESAEEAFDLINMPLPFVQASLLFLAPCASVQIVINEHPSLPVSCGFAAQHGLRGPPVA